MHGCSYWRIFYILILVSTTLPFCFLIFAFSYCGMNNFFLLFIPCNKFWHGGHPFDASGVGYMERAPSIIVLFLMWCTIIFSIPHRPPFYSIWKFPFCFKGLHSKMEWLPPPFTLWITCLWCFQMPLPLSLVEDNTKITPFSLLCNTNPFYRRYGMIRGSQI